MRRILILLAAASVLCSCGLLGSTPKDLYYWGPSGLQGAYAYEENLYRNFKEQSPESVCALICTYEDVVSNPGGQRNMPPPGICAEYGYLLLQAGTAETFANYATDTQKKYFATTAYGDYFRERGAEMFETEMKNYPESALFLKPLIQKIKSQL